MEEKKNRSDADREFRRGICFGVLLAGIVMLAFFLMRYGTIGSRPRQEAAELLTSTATRKKLKEVEDLIAENYLGDVDPQLLETYLYKGIAVGLDDIYANYYSPEELDQVNQQNQGSYFGIGVTFQQDEEEIVVRKVYDDSPAKRAGILAGDILREVNGRSVEGMSFDRALELLREGEEVTLTLLRGEEEVEITCGFAEVTMARILARMLDAQTGYLQIPEFDRVTPAQFQEALDELKEQGMSRLVLDVRDNPGGLLTSVCSMLDELLEDELFVAIESRNLEREELFGQRGSRFSGPMAVLVNKESASAAEVFAGTLQYYGLAKLVGEQTYGKGVVQTTFPLEDGSALKLTTEKYYIAGEEDIDGVGLTPDLTVDVKSEGEKASAAEAAEEKESGAEAEEEKETDGGDSLEEDRVLQAAVRLLSADGEDGA